jgi:peptide/nickel transport system permease protein
MDLFKGSTFNKFATKLLGRPIAIIGLVVFLILVLLSIWFSFFPVDNYTIHAEEMLRPPSLRHPMGTDEFGRDMMFRIFDSSRITLIVGVVAVSIALVTGTILGLVSGFFGGKIDLIITSINDAVWAFPTLILALAISIVLGAGLANVVIAIGIVSIPAFTRVVRSVVLTVKQSEYVEGAISIGLNKFEIILRYILPNISSVIIVQASLNAASAIISEASLSFLGLGIQLPQSSWGSMLKKGFSFITTAPWLSIFPGLAIFVTVLALNFLGDGLRDALDVKIRID